MIAVLDNVHAYYSQYGSHIQAALTTSLEPINKHLQVCCRALSFPSTKSKDLSRPLCNARLHEVEENGTPIAPMTLLSGCAGLVKVLRQTGS